MPDSQELKDLEAEEKSLTQRISVVQKAMHVEQWRIVQEETGVREGSVVTSFLRFRRLREYEFRVTGLHSYNPHGHHFLLGRIRLENGQFNLYNDTIITEEWKLEEKNNA